MKKKDSRYYRMIQSKRWRELRRAKLNADPCCEMCLENGLYVSATEVHHKTPCETALTQGEMEQLMFSFGNLQSLCHAHHQEAHRRLESRSRKEITARNAARTQRFIDKYLDNKDERCSFLSQAQNHTNPLCKGREKKVESEESVGVMGNKQ